MDKLEVLRNAAEVLNDEGLLEKINNIEEGFESKTYMLSVMGQFSAGKSALINSLLERDILPVHITEATTAITYIKYADEEEYANMISEDNQYRKIDVDEVGSIWKDGMTPDGTPVEEIVRLDIYVKSELLKNGLIIVDTPGINTIVKRNEAITVGMLKKTDEILYVMSKDLTVSDISYVKTITENGIPLSFVRSHSDKIRSTEENAEKTIAKTREELKKISPEAKVIFTSTDKRSEYYNGINELRSYIVSAISNDIEKRAELSAKARANVISGILSEELNGKVKLMRDKAENDGNELRKKLDAVERRKKSIQNNLDRRKKNIERGFRAADEDALSSTKRSRDKCILKFEDYLKTVSIDSSYTDEIYNEAYSRLEEGYKDIYYAYKEAYDKFISENNSEMLEELSFGGIDTDKIPVCSSINEIVNDMLEKNEELNELESKITGTQNLIEELEARLDELHLSEEEYEEAKAGLEDLKLQIEESKKELGEYKPVYIVDDKGAGMRSAFGNVGKALDWAALLIPGAAYEKLFAQAAKLTTSAKNATNIFTKMGKVASKTDPIKDTLFAMKNLFPAKKKEVTTDDVKKYASDTKGKLVEKGGAGILEMLTFEHWFEKLGEKIGGKAYPQRRP
ncbi:MAG: dynamin family protein [Clostridiales bacterium]|nr:dynamin family protein [Clostridiales bacterium]